jgi:hypothetical protein
MVSRFAPTKHRARMMACVFFSQPLGQIMGNLISLIVVAISRNNASSTDNLQRSVDIVSPSMMRPFPKATLPVGACLFSDDIHRRSPPQRS